MAAGRQFTRSRSVVIVGTTEGPTLATTHSPLKLEARTAMTHGSSRQDGNPARPGGPSTDDFAKKAMVTAATFAAVSVLAGPLAGAVLVVVPAIAGPLVGAVAAAIYTMAIID